MTRALKILLLLPALLFLSMGLRWLVAPEGMARELGLSLDVGVGLSSQVGDLSAFFLTVGSCILLALVTERRLWLYPPMMLLSLAALGRVLAWLLHDATLAIHLIAPELVLSVLLFVASRQQLFRN